jgi:hypothetical protein
MPFWTRILVTTFTIVLLSIAGVLFLIKIILTTVRHLRNPIKGASITDADDKLKREVV